MNVDAPNGFHFYRDRFGAAEPRIVTFDIGSGVSGTIGRGQPCTILAASGHIVEINGTYATDLSTAKGIYIAQKACVAGDQDVPFIVAAGMDFVCQVDDNASWSTEAALQIVMHGAAPWFQISNPNSISTDGLNRSIAEIAGTGPHATNGYCRIVGWKKDPRNEFGPFQDVIVRFNPTLSTDSPDFSL